MNRRDLAIQNWVKEHRPDLLSQLPRWFENEAVGALLAIAFEAGRTFQHHINAELGDQNVYLDDDKVGVVTSRITCSICGGVPNSPNEIYSPNVGMAPCQMPIHRSRPTSGG